MAMLDRIAEVAGVSRDTVARALSNRTKGSWASTQRRVDEIRRIAAELGYRPNAAARAARSGRHNAVALVTRQEKTDFFPFSLIRGLCDTLAEYDMHMVIARVPVQEIGREGTAPKIAREFAVDGLLIHEGIDVDSAVTDMIRRHNVPTIWINTKQPADCVYPDDREAAARMTATLIGLGHRRVEFHDFYVDWSAVAAHYSTADRIEGYSEAMRDAGLAPVVSRVAYRESQPPAVGAPWGSSSDDRLQRAKTVLQRRDRPTAIVTPGIDTAGPFLQAAATLGIRVPEQLSITTIQDEVSTQSGLAISTMPIPMLECGRLGVAALVQKIESGEAMPAQAVRFGDLQGQTVAKPEVV